MGVVVGTQGETTGGSRRTFFGIIYLLVGFWDTLVFVVFVSTGYYIGRKLDHKEDLREILDRILPGKFR